MNINLQWIPDGLKEPLFTEYNKVIQHYLEGRWTASELSGGKFCEIVYTILEGYSTWNYPGKPKKPANFVDACKKLENATGMPRSFQILIPRMLPALYEIRNNRSVGHVGGDVDSNPMDSRIVVSMCGWILAEMIRVLHGLSILEAQKVVDFISERKIPLVWEKGGVKRVLDPKIGISDQVILLVASKTWPTDVDSLFCWIESGNKGYFLRTLRKLHKNRLLELSADEKSVWILPPGVNYVEKLLAKRK